MVVEADVISNTGVKSIVEQVKAGMLTLSKAYIPAVSYYFFTKANLAFLIC
jgi:hypothetical protein